MNTELSISISEQSLSLLQDSKTLQCWQVSTAANGIGQKNGSFCTPLGQHLIRAKIGKDSPLNTVFVGRRPSGEIFKPELREQFPSRDWILTRILWLSGTQPGYNRLGEVDTMRRYIYLHGCPDDVEMGKPGSHGCIRMRNKDIVNLFDLVEVGTPVTINA